MNTSQKFKELTGLDWITVSNYIYWVAKEELDSCIRENYDMSEKWRYCSVDGAEEYLEFLKDMCHYTQKEEVEKIWIAEYEFQMADLISCYYSDALHEQELDSLSRGPL